MSDGRARTQQSANERPGRRLIGWMVVLLLCLTSTAWAAEMVTNGGFNTIASWTLGGTGASYSTAQNHGTLAGVGSILQYSGARNTTTTGTEAQSVSVAAGSVIQNKADVSLWAMQAWTGGSSATQTVTVALRYADATTVQIFTGTVTPGSSWTNIANATLTAFPLTLTQNVNQITVTTVTRGGTVNPSTSSLYVDDIAVVYTPAATDSLTVTSNTSVATTAQPGNTNIQMSFMQLNSDATGNGNCVVTSATVDDVNIAATGTIANLKVHIDNDTNFVNGVLGTATVATWNGQPTVVDLTGIAAVDRTVTSGTPKYLWVTYDIDAAAVNGTTVQSSVSAIGVLAPDTAPLGGPWDSNAVLITIGLSCGGCHPNPMVDGVSRDPATGGVVGSHTKHASTQGYDCILCHLATPATPRHRDTFIAIVDPIQGKVNAKYTTIGKSGVSVGAGFVKFTQVTSPVRGNCQNTDCHGGTNAATFYGGPAGSGPQWGTTSADACTFCHNSNKTNSGGAANAYPTATSPFRTSAASFGAQNIHALHLTSTLKTMVCADCHTSYATIGDAGHIDTATVAAPADVPFPAGSAALLNTSSPSYATYVCSNVYCHGAKMPKGDDSGSARAPNWSTGNWTNFPTGCTAACHGLPPKTGASASISSHASVTAGDLTSCKTCHGDTVTSTTNPPTMSTVFHINGALESTGCTGCHGTDPKQYPPLSKWGTNRSTADGVGAHVAHIEATATYMTKELITGEADLTGYWCAECHTTTRGATGHDDASYPANIVFTNAVESKYNTHTPTITFEADNNPDLGNGATCSVYCHGVKMPKGDTSGTTKTPTWGVTLTGCNVCHGAPPTAGTSAGTHSGKAFPTSCITCHPKTVLSTTNPPTLDPAFHINGILEASGCNGCHGGDNATWSNKNFWPSAGAAYPKRGGEHEPHINALMTKLGYSIATITDAQQQALCDYCHNDAAGSGGTNHDDSGTPVAPANVGSFNRIWDATVDAGGVAATYVTATNTCSNVDCHNEKSTTTNNNDWFDASASSCIVCHTVGGTNSATIAHPASGIHDVARITGRLHDDSFAYGTSGASTGNCITCHTATPTSASGHINGVNNYSIGAVGGATRVTLDTAVGFTDAVVPTCSPTQANGCHIEQWNAVTDHTWVHQWHESAGNNDGTECRGCHGTFTQAWQSGVSPVHTTNFDGDGSAEVRLNHDHGSATETAYNQCISCHVYNDALYGTMGWNPTAASKHGNGQIEMITAMGYATASNTCSNTCHNVPEVGSHAMTPDSGWTVANLAGPSLTCTSCHTGTGSGGLKVGSSSPHTTTTKGGANGSAACSVCHPEHTGGVLIANKTNVGIAYTAGGRTGFRLGGTGTTGSTEAEICWNCHDGVTVGEWGTNTNGTYNYGTVYTTSAKTTQTSKWIGTYWTSANFTYKDGNLNTGMGANGASTHGLLAGGAQGVDLVTEIGCSYCHDVHDLNLLASDTSTGKPYLRGSWKTSPYKEDGAPQSTTTYPSTNIYSGTQGSLPAVEGMPREGTGQTTLMGGYWIDQNSGNPANGTYATHAGLCTLCHGDGDGVAAEAADVTAIETAWSGHKNSVAGGAGTGGASIFRTSLRNGDGTWNGGMYMAAMNSTRRNVGSNYAGSLRNEDYADGVSPLVANNPRAWNVYSWGATVDDSTTAQSLYHKFTCSKCHTPHASRLPRLLITNCLDVRHNTWDDQFTGDAKWANWAAVGISRSSKQFAYTSTAQNCHRYADMPAGGTVEETGWNALTPW